METRELTIRVTPEAADVYTTASQGRRLMLDVLISAWLREVGKPSRSFEELHREVSDTAVKNGLTPEILDDILNER